MKADPRIQYGDMTSFESWTLLCNLINEALAPAVAYSDIGFEILLSCMSLSTSAKRRISKHTSSEFLLWSFNAMVQLADNPTPDSKLALVTELLEMGVERNIFYDYASRVRVIGIVPDNARIDVAKVMHQTDYYLTLYEQFRQNLVYRYYRFAQNAAVRNHITKENVGLLSSANDQSNVFVLSLMRAIDKFVPYKGTLTNYIKEWFIHAAGGSAYNIYGDEAYSLPRSARRDIKDGVKDNRNKAIPIEESRHVEAEATPISNIDPKALLSISQLENAHIMWMMFDMPFDPIDYLNRSKQ